MNCVPGALLSGVATLCLVAGQPAAQEHSAPQRFTVPGHGSLALPVPREWRAVGKSLDKPASVLLRIRPASGDAFLVQVTALWLDAEKLARKTPEQLRQDVQSSAKAPLQQSIEKEVRLEELRGAQAIGYYYSLTDRAPVSGEYRYLTQGIVVAGEMLTIFTILQREAAIAERGQLLQMLANATHAPSAASAAGGFLFDMPEPRLRIAVPDIPQIAMAVHPNAAAQPHARFMGNDDTGYSISVLMPTADPGMTPLDCARSSSGGIVSRYGLDRKAVRMHQTNESTFVMLFPVRIGPLVQFKAYLLSGHGGTHCVEVHISKTVTLASQDAVATDLANWYQGFGGATISSY